MLRKFTVNNFKSLINVTYELGVVNLLVGANNSGKTSLCQALRFFSQTARTRNFVESEFGTNVYFDHQTVDLSCICDISRNTGTLKFHYTLSLNASPRVIIGPATEQLRVSGGQFGSNEITLLENNAGQARLLNEVYYLQGKPLDSCYQETTVTSINTMLSQLYDRQANWAAIGFRDYLAGWQYYDLESHRLRDDRFDPQANLLDSDGAYLASVLFQLKNRDERLYRQLLELTQKVEKRLDALNFTTAGERIHMELTDERNNRFGINHASSGTLRFIALAYIILNNARQSNPPLTIIEEPENGLYVRYLKELFNLIDPTGSGGQYIFTSHSPYFIDLFEDYIENIILMEDRGTYSALLKPDPAKVRKYLEKMPLGELHFREMLV